MGPFSRPLPGLSVGLFRIMFGMLWLHMALQKAPWVFNAGGTALWVALELDLDGDAVSDVWLL